MSRRHWGFAALLAGSLLLGVMVGQIYFRLFLHTVPPLALSGFNRGAAHLAFLAYGVAAGIVIFAWSLLIAWLSPRLGGWPDEAP
jgi:hypothetical protein